jgi:PAS domain S-box-containing protein
MSGEDLGIERTNDALGAENIEHVLDAITAGITLVDRGYKILYANQSILEFTGTKERKSIIGRPCYEVLFEKDAPCDWCNREKGFETREPQYSQISLPGTGGVRSFELYTYPSVDSENMVCQIVEMAKEGAEKARLESQIKKLATIANTSADAMMSVDLDGRFEFWNTGAEALFGYNRVEMLGNNFQNFVPPELKEEAEVKRRIALKKGFVRYETLRLRKDGMRVPVDMTLTVITDDMGYPTGVAGSIKDLSEKERIESELRETKNHLESIFDTIQEAICVIDKGLKIVSFNEAFAKNTNAPRGEILGKRCYEVLHEYSDDEFNRFCTEQCIVIKAFEGGEPTESVHHHELDGELLYHESRALPTKNAEGETDQVVYIINDATEKKSAENALKTYATELERSNKLKDLFADIMRHDLLNPLGVVKNVFELIDDDVKSPEVERELSMVHRNIEKIEDLVQSAARFGQVESAEELEFEPRDLGNIVRQVAVDLKTSAAEKDMKVIIPEGNYPAEVNLFIEDVFSNLISNAIKYSPQNTPVTVTVEDMGVSWKISVSDKGTGVPDEHKKDIFERFKRVEKGSVKGSGLGLAIVKKVVELHNGDVWVEDNPGGGSIFAFTVPKKRKANV